MYLFLHADACIPHISGTYKFGLMSEGWMNLLYTSPQGSLGQTAQGPLFQTLLPWHLPRSAHRVSPMCPPGGRCWGLSKEKTTVQHLSKQLNWILTEAQSLAGKQGADIIRVWALWSWGSGWGTLWGSCGLMPAVESWLLRSEWCGLAGFRKHGAISGWLSEVCSLRQVAIDSLNWGKLSLIH